MEKERKIKLIAISALIVAVLGLTIAFASLSQTLTINGAATLDAAKWGIKFENLSSGKVVGDATINDTAIIAEDQITINNIDVSLKTPGDSVTYTVDLVNEGTINAEIYSIEVPSLTEEQKKYINFKVTYDNGEEVKQGDILNKETKKNLTIKVEFKKDITESDLPKSGEEISLSYKLNFVQTDENDTTEGSDGTTDNYGDEIRSWNLSDTVKMTYYNGELQSDGTYDNGDLVISGTGAIPGAIFDDNDTPTNIPVLFKLADVSSLNEIQLDKNSLPILKYNSKNLIIENGITSIGTYSFYALPTLVKVSLPDTITEISSGAFINCTSLTSIYMPNVTTIGENSFSNCTSLETINLPNVTTIGENSFSNCTSLETINLPNVTTIDKNSFSNCTSLETINLPNAINIGTFAFKSCVSLKSVDIQKVTTINSEAFHGCTSLTYINMPNVETIGGAAFGACTSLTSAYIPNVITIENYAFNGCIALNNVIISNKISSIGTNIFYNISSSITIYVPDEDTKNKINHFGSSKITIVVDSTKFE